MVRIPLLAAAAFAAPAAAFAHSDATPHVHVGDAVMTPLVVAAAAIAAFAVGRLSVRSERASERRVKIERDDDTRR